MPIPVTKKISRITKRRDKTAMIASSKKEREEVGQREKKEQQLKTKIPDSKAKK